MGVRVRLISDGDVASAIETAKPGSPVDIMLGVGGTPEGVIAGECCRRALVGLALFLLSVFAHSVFTATLVTAKPGPPVDIMLGVDGSPEGVIPSEYCMKVWYTQPRIPAAIWQYSL